LATRNFTTFLAGILIDSPVAGLRPILALRSIRASRPSPGTTNKPFFSCKRGAHGLQHIEKAILFMLSTNVAQALVILVAILVGFTAPITAPQILWVNMVTSVAHGLVSPSSRMSSTS
jgi:hypothetical protein